MCVAILDLDRSRRIGAWASCIIHHWSRDGSLGGGVGGVGAGHVRPVCDVSWVWGGCG